MKPTVSCSNPAPIEPEEKRTFDVYVVVQHTRSGDQRHAVIDNQGPESRELALDRAERIANDAASIYGFGSASVFAGTLTLNTEPESP